MDGREVDELEWLARKRQISRRRLLDRLLKLGGVAALAGPGAALLQACGGEAPKNGTTRPVPPGYPPVNTRILGGKITLRILLAQDYANEAPFKDLYVAFQKVYPNVTLQVDNAVWEDIPTKVKTAALGGAPIDVMHQHAFEFGHIGLAENVDDLWARWGKVGDFLPNSLKDVTWAGKRYGVPLDVNCMFTVYNKDLLAQFGAVAPTSSTTWPQLQQELQKFAGKGVFGIGLTNGAWNNFGFVHSNGGDLLNDQQNRATINTRQNVAVIKLISELGWKGKIGSNPSPTKRQDEPTALFLARQSAVLLTGPWDLPDIKKAGLKVGTTELPKGMSGSTSGSVQGGGSLFIGKGAKNREAAFEFMKWCTAPPHQVRMVKEMGRWPVIKSVYTDPGIGAGDPLVQPYFSQLATAVPYTLEAYPEGDKAWSDAVAAAYNGMDAQQALDSGQKIASAVVK